MLNMANAALLLNLLSNT